MIIRKSEIHPKKIVDCHEGRGILWCTEMLTDYKKKTSGFKYIHDNTLEPGASIGEHKHKEDEEIYVILYGSGAMRVDGKKEKVSPGDICITRSGHSHDLTNTGTTPMHFLVIAANL
jgi:uncharacterized cupin superfamily protein